SRRLRGGGFLRAVLARCRSSGCQDKTRGDRDRGSELSSPRQDSTLPQLSHLIRFWCEMPELPTPQPAPQRRSADDLVTTWLRQPLGRPDLSTLVPRAGAVYTGHAGRVTAGEAERVALEESPDTTGQDAGASQAAKADGKWNRKQTATGASPEAPAVRVKRWSKSPPATAATRRLAKPRPVQGEQGPPPGCPPRARGAAKS